MRTLLESTGRDPGAIPTADIKHFCRHARYLRLVRCRPLHEDAAPSGGRADALRAALASEADAANAALGVLLRAVDRFQAQHGRLPGSGYEEDVEQDVPLLKAAAGGVLAELGAAAAPLSDDLVAEVVRCGGGELHAVAAGVGAMASQEGIKLLTGQFVPLGGTLVYNAMYCTTSVLQI